MKISDKHRIINRADLNSSGSSSSNISKMFRAGNKDLKM